MGRKLNIEKGMKFGMLTVIGDGETLRLPSGQVNRTIDCICDCGKTKNVRLVHLYNGRIRSCGCLNGGLHGDAGKPLHTTWRGMNNRCKAPGINRRSYYDKGIKVCEEWKRYIGFRDWALKNGYRDELYIDRIDNSKGYEPNNCRFVTNMENCNNRDNTFYVIYHGEKYPIMDLLRSKGLLNNGAAIRGRIERGWSVDDAFDTKIKSGNYFKKYV